MGACSIAPVMRCSPSLQVQSMRFDARCGYEKTWRHKDASSTDRLQLRFGLHLADVMVTGNDLIGDGVNLAARIQQSAKPDAICVSQPLFDQIKRYPSLTG